MHAPIPAPDTVSPQPLLRQDADHVAVLTLNRPERRNSLSEEMLAAITGQLDDIARDRATRAVVIAANGPVFCAGHDLKELSARRKDPDGGRAYFQEIMARCSAVMQAITSIPQPVIAAVQGTATAAGCQLVAACDLAVASSAATFCTPGVNIGLFCSTPMVALSRNVAPKHAMEMLLTGEMTSAAHAYRIGLVNRVVPSGEELEQALALARGIASKSAFTVTTGKTAFYRQLDMSLSEAYRYASQVMVENMMADDAEEGIAAFLEKRMPTWQGW
jgi:enoyl-CoA hydratase/carnithine racemase